MTDPIERLKEALRDADERRFGLHTPSIYLDGLMAAIRSVLPELEAMEKRAEERRPTIARNGESLIWLTRDELRKLEAMAAHYSICECGHLLVAHQGHTSSIGEPFPTHCSQGDGCHAFRLAAHPDLAGAIERARAAGWSLRFSTMTGYWMLRISAEYDHRGGQHVSPGPHEQFATLDEAAAWLDGLGKEGR